MQQYLTGRTAATDQAGHRHNLDELLHPANAFAHPADVVSDPDLTLSEKRAILGAWASDVRMAEAVPAMPGNRRVPFDDIIAALRDLDPQVRKPPRPHYKRVLADRRPGVFGGRSQMPIDPHKPSLN